MWHYIGMVQQTLSAVLILMAVSSGRMKQQTIALL